MLGVTTCAAEKVKAALVGRDRVYLLIVNTQRECVIGGDRGEVERLIEDLSTRFFPLQGVVTVHCPVLQPVADAYRAHHLFETRAPAGIQFYSGGWGKAYDVTRETAADAILAQALTGVDFPKTIRAAYKEGFNVFLEMGPGASCSRMIDKILGDQPHLAVSASAPTGDEVTQVLRLLGRLISERVRVDLSFLRQTAPDPPRRAPTENYRFLSIPVARKTCETPPAPRKKLAKITARANPSNVTPRPAPNPLIHEQPAKREPSYMRKPTLISPTAASARTSLATDPLDIVAGAASANTARARAHDAYLRFARNGQRAIAETLDRQLSLIQALGQGGGLESHNEIFEPATAPIGESFTEPRAEKPFLDREQCLEFARGSLAKVLGPDFAEIDNYPTRVRLPDEPLMLVDRILEVGGEEMDHGHVVTEHDVLVDGWYLDAGRIPTCIAIEAGQADLFLSAWLGADFITKGLASYRLLDAAVTFHGPLPEAGLVIRYDIQILRFFRQGNTRFFYFQFEGSVNGEPLLTMRNGCAGFFSPEELDAGKGIVRPERRSLPTEQTPASIWQWAPMEKTAYDKDQLNALRRGDLAGCFGDAFSGLPLKRPLGLPDGRMNLVDRVVELDPEGGDYALGLIRAEADIHPEDWFLTCHFVDDQVMPGTLMYECCLHTFRVFLYRMGWVGESSELSTQPVIGVTSRLKCRGQVLATTKVVTYEVHLKNVGYEPEPHAVADAVMYADGKAIVDITDMCIRFVGLTRQKLERTWRGRARSEHQAMVRQSPVFDYQRLLAFAAGKPSEAFGERYQPFDQGRQIARFPKPPFLMMTRVNRTDVAPWTLTEGGTAQVAYDVPVDAWYFREDRQGVMPYSILLEVSLQSCGWVAAYMGSALASEKDLAFRNLGGTAVQHLAVTPETGTLTTDVTVTSISKTGDVILQFYTFETRSAAGVVFKGETYFGFFSEAALARQVGVQDAALYSPNRAERERGLRFELSREAPFPGEMMRMIDQIEITDGGPHGLGYIEGAIQVDSAAWFFEAHFFQDPVWPGSLGMESFIQLLKAFAWRRWDGDASTRFTSPTLNGEHGWVYRGQILPTNKRVVVQAHIKSIDDANRTVIADGYLIVDDLPIYQITNFSLAAPSP